MRKQSQIELSMNAAVSQRHLSFIELGRSVPSPELIIRLSHALDIPYRDRNALLLAAGYAPRYEERGWNPADRDKVTDALQRVLRQQEPYPALVLDRHWNVLLTNAAAPRFFGHFVDLSSRPKPRNLLHLMFDPTALRPFIADWENVAAALIKRLYHEAIGGVLDDHALALIEELMSYPGFRPEWQMPMALNMSISSLPVIPIGFRREGHTLSYFSMLTTLATPQSIAAQELRIESMFPLDAATETQHALLMSS